ncbi:uncharacterized protein EDB91DRAFT_1062560 [Suillus paluster]|uniref:uncharacterized protein n=1 Tax=Suillus paluster TaxID=48578 RepID=UPI001B85C4E9|nr:uncharacterized protein EDB91DRAFT_1062560 [Suillus paluster]KAG1724877.1 hypothetical protein EDB91DRAFT_1062560 [Suillus paluster]
MLDYALKHQDTVNTITQWWEVGLWKFELEDHEWTMLGQLRDVLKILKDATLYFSRATPNLTTVIPAMDHIYNMLTSYSHNKKYMLSICSAVQLTKNTLNRYYQLTDNSVTYQIAMVLHPQHKLAYFKATQWEDDWIETADRLVHEEFKCLYLSINDNSDVESKDNVFKSNDNVLMV